MLQFIVTLLTIAAMLADTANRRMSLSSVRSSLPGSVIDQIDLPMSAIPVHIRRLVLFQSAYIRHDMRNGNTSEN